MKEPRFFKLDDRLTSCVNFIRKDTRIADIGTDHAYLPIYLLKTGKIQYAVASDIRKGPLLNAMKNAEKYHLTDKISLRLSNGLEKIYPDEVDDIIIAGMGGELIVSILSNVDWIKNGNKRLILQPMSMDEKVRTFLHKEHFKIVNEKIVISKRKVYVVICAQFYGKDYNVDALYPFIGTLRDNLNDETKIYIDRKIKSLKNQLRGVEKSTDSLTYDRMQNIIDQLRKLSEGESDVYSKRHL